MTDRNLESPATALWIPGGQIPPAGAVWGGEKRIFGTLGEAIRFVMVELVAADRATAWITVDDGPALPIEEIEQIYASAADLKDRPV